MMYSPDAGGAACAPTARMHKKVMSKRRFIMAGEWTIYAGSKNAQVVRRTVAVSLCEARPGHFKPARGTRPKGLRLQQLNFIAHEIFPCLPFVNQRELVAANQRLGRQRPRIVVRSH